MIIRLRSHTHSFRCENRPPATYAYRARTRYARDFRKQVYQVYVYRRRPVLRSGFLSRRYCGARRV